MYRCIPLLWQCDGEHDCPNGEDEENCSGYLMHCHVHHVRAYEF